MKNYKVLYDKDRVEEAKSRVRDWYKGNSVDRIPFVFTPPCKGIYTMGEIVEDTDKAIESMIHRFNTVMPQFPDSDLIPFYKLTYLGEGLIPTMFGARQVVTEKNPPYTEGRVLKDLENDLKHLPKRIDPDTDGWGPKLKDTVLKFLDATHGEIPVSVCDYQSPYGVATKLVGNEDLMLAMYDTPELVHELMEISTNAIIDTIRAMERWTGNPDLVLKNTKTAIPDSGMIIWDDYISVLSPELHKEFCLPYNMRLYNEFGKGHLHTCGPYFPGFINSVLEHKPVSIDSIILRQTNRTREDMLLLKKTARENGIKLIGTLSAFPAGLHYKKAVIPPDREFVMKMIEGGDFFWNAGGSVDLGMEYLKIVKEYKIPSQV